MASTWDVISRGQELFMRVTSWHLCRFCLRGHMTVTENERFVRLENMDGTPVLHRR